MALSGARPAARTPIVAGRLIGVGRPLIPPALEAPWAAYTLHGPRATTTSCQKARKTAQACNPSVGKLHEASGGLAPGPGSGGSDSDSRGSTGPTPGAATASTHVDWRTSRCATHRLRVQRPGVPRCVECTETSEEPSVCRNWLSANGALRVVEASRCPTPAWRWFAVRQPVRHLASHMERQQQMCAAAAAGTS